jgi:hypothetical protein
MSNRDVRWLQRRTNIADLLDDGIENYSDVRAGSVPSAESESGGSPVAPPIARPAVKQQPVDGPARLPMSWFGILIGLGMAASSAHLFLFPVDMMVYHQRMKRPSFIEHVTPERSRIYGAAGVLIGFGMVGFSLYRPRR